MNKTTRSHRTRATRTVVGCGDCANCTHGLPQFCLAASVSERGDALDAAAPRSRGAAAWDERADFLRAPHADLGWLLLPERLSSRRRRDPLVDRFFHRADAAEQRLCLRLNRSCRHPAVRELFRIVSRLGNGMVWYLLMLMVPVAYGARGVRPALQMALGAALGAALYLLLKTRLVRERPYITHAGIEAHSAPLDRYSFPSGHTLHAVCLTLIATSHFPELALVLVPLALLIAASRVVLGLHYPSDVLAGGAIGAVLGTTILALTSG